MIEERGLKIVIACPSYKRPKVETLDYIPFCRVYVDEGEYEDYRKANPPTADIVSCKRGIQGNLCRIRNHIIREELEHNGADVLLIIDDDMKGIYYFEGKKAHKVETDAVPDFVAKHSILARDIGAFFWGVNVNDDKQCYREYTPFSTVSYIGGPFQCFLKGNDCYYDENLPLKEDYDMTLQQLNKHRVVFRVNKFYYNVKQAENVGGCATYRNFEREKDQLMRLRRKWGSRIVHIDKSSRSHKSDKTRGKTFDFNPVIIVPIKGV